MSAVDAGAVESAMEDVAVAAAVGRLARVDVDRAAVATVDARQSVAVVSSAELVAIRSLFAGLEG